MKAVLPWVVVLALFAVTGFAEEANGLRLTAQKTILEREKELDTFSTWDKVNKALGLRVNARNISFKDVPEGTLDYIVIVKRWGRNPDLIEKYSGTEKLPALAKGAEANLTVGKIPLGGYEASGNRKQYQDSIEGWQVIVKHDGAETIKITSTSAFEKLLSKAKPAKVEKPGKK